MKLTKTTSIISFAALALVACGSGGGNSTATTAAAVTTTPSTVGGTTAPTTAGATGLDGTVEPRSHGVPDDHDSGRSGDAAHGPADHRSGGGSARRVGRQDR